MKRKYYLIPLFFVVSCFVVAGIVRFSYRNNLMNQIQNYTYMAGNDSLNFLDDYGFKSSKDIMDGSDLIIQGICSGKQQVTDDALYTQIKIEKVYKGDSSFLGRTITVVQEMTVIQNDQAATYINAGLNCMIPIQEKSEYLLLLKHIPQDSAKKVDLQQYYITTRSAFGMYKYSSQRQNNVVDAENHPLKMNELRDIDIYAITKQQLDRYYEYKAKIFQEFKL